MSSSWEISVFLGKYLNYFGLFFFYLIVFYVWLVIINVMGMMERFLCLCFKLRINELYFVRFI